MSPDNNTDLQSASQPRRRADALRNHDRVLDAADALFAASDAPALVTMDDVAKTAGVGKGTLFRAFGDRSGLVSAAWSRRYAPLRDALTERRHPFDDATSARDQILALADAIARVKLDNWHLALAAEESPAGSLTSPSYTAAHTALMKMLDLDRVQRTTVPGRAPSHWTAHAVLAVLRADLIAHHLATGATPTTIRRNLRVLVTTLVT
jgi:AcrR family transcriptional regulator